MADFIPEYPGDNPNRKYVRDKEKEKGIFEEVEKEALRRLIYRGLDSEDTRAYINVTFAQIMAAHWPRGMWAACRGVTREGKPVVLWIHP